MTASRSRLLTLIAVALCAVAAGLYTIYQVNNQRFAAAALIRFEGERPHIVGSTLASRTFDSKRSKQSGLEAIQDGIQSVVKEGKSLDDPLVRKAMLRVFAESGDARSELGKRITTRALGDSELFSVQMETGDRRHRGDCETIINAVAQECVQKLTAVEHREQNREMNSLPNAEFDGPPRVAVVRLAGTSPGR